MFAHTLLHKLISLIVALGMVLTPVTPAQTSATKLSQTTDAASISPLSAGTAVVIRFDGVQFTPASVIVAIGDTIEWLNESTIDKTLEAAGLLEVPEKKFTCPWWSPG